MFNLTDKIKKVKTRIKPYENDIILVAVIILVALISFGLGRLSKIKESKTPITIENLSSAVINSSSDIEPNNRIGESAQISPAQNEKLFVASKNGTKYHYPWCSGALRIKEENKIWFSTKEEAKKSGYSPASNCKGL